MPADPELGEDLGCSCGGWTWLQKQTHLGLVTPGLVQLCDLKQCTCPFRASETASECLSGLPGRLSGGDAPSTGWGLRVMVSHTASVFLNLPVPRHLNGRLSWTGEGAVLEEADVHRRLVLVLQT